MNGRRRKRGSILVFTFLGIIVIGILASSLAFVQYNEQLRDSRETTYTSRRADINSVRGLLQAASARAFLEQDNSEVANYLPQLQTAAGSALSGVTITDINFSNITPFSRSNGYGPLPPNNPHDAPYRVTHAIEYDFSARLEFSGLKAGQNSASIGAYIDVIEGHILEIPTVNYQLVTYGSPFEGTSNNLTVQGKALFPFGTLGTGSYDTTSIDEHSVSFAPTSGNSTGLNFAQARKGGYISWGLSNMSDLFLTSATGIAADQSFLLENTSTTKIVNWTDPAVAPNDLPLGIKFETFNGANRLRLDLSLMAESSHYYINCSAATRDSGIVIDGAGTSILSPVSIVTDGKVSLNGDNLRECLIASSYSGNHAIFSSAYADGTSGLPAISSSFLGYLFFLQPNLEFDLIEDWSSADYSITGSLVYEGGTLVLPDTTNIVSDDDFVNTFANGIVRSDRFFYVAF